MPKRKRATVVPKPITLHAELYDAYIGQGNSKKLSFGEWLKKQAEDERATLRAAARCFLGLPERQEIIHGFAICKFDMRGRPLSRLSMS